MANEPPPTGPAWGTCCGPVNVWRCSRLTLMCAEPRRQT